MPDAPGEESRPSRATVLAGLAAEQDAAARAGNWERAAELNREIGRLSAGAAASPLRETAAASPERKTHDVRT